MNKSDYNINTGKLLMDFILKKRLTFISIGRKINRTGKSIFKYTENISIQTGILLEICHATKHNFFQDIANQIPSDFTINTDIKSPKDELIAQLQQEINVLKIQNELLMKLKG